MLKKYCSYKLEHCFLDRLPPLESRKKQENSEESLSNSEDYTIFHALMEAMVKKEQKQSRLNRVLNRLRLAK